MTNAHTHCPAYAPGRRVLLGMLHPGPFTWKSVIRVGLKLLGWIRGGHMTPFHIISHIVGLS
jgi:hypothetical protein